MPDLELMQRRLEREKAARKAAETLLEQKSLEVYEANQRLIDLTEQTKAIVETAAEGIISYDEEGVIHLFNRSAERIFQCQEAIGKNIRDYFELLDEEDYGLFPVCNVVGPEEAHLGEESCISDPIEMTGRRTTGQSFFAEVMTNRNTSGKKTQFTMLVRDLSRRKKLEAQLSQSRKMESVGQLAAGIAHEINTPIQFVGDNILFLQGAFDDLGNLLDLYADLADEVAKGNSSLASLSKIKEQSEIADLPFLRQEAPDAIQQSIDGIERVAKIVRAMKEFSQASSDCKTLVDLNGAIENTITVTVNQYRDTAEIETCFDPEIGSVSCLAGKINQCLLNLLANAYEVLQEHGEPGTGKVRVTTKRNGDFAEIRVEDNGPGIPDDIRERIFEPFFTTKEVGKGMGQGLAYVYDVVVDKHDGQIQVQPLPTGGTSFLITLPIQASSAEVLAQV